MSKVNISVVGGKLESKALTLAALNKDEKDFDVAKAIVWSNLLKDRMKPTKWFKTTKTGTKISFDYINSMESYHAAVGELEGYLKYINKKHGMDLYLTSGGEST